MTLPVLDLGLFFSASNTEPIIVDRGDLFWYLRASAAFFTDEPQGVVWSESFVYEITSKYYAVNLRMPALHETPTEIPALMCESM